VAGNWQIVQTGDFNADGKSDLLWRDTNTGTVAVWLLNGLSVLQSGSLGGEKGYARSEKSRPARMEPPGGPGGSVRGGRVGDGERDHRR